MKSIAKFRKASISVIAAAGIILMPGTPARADAWGGDVVILTQILANAVQQLIQLKQILDAGKDSLSLLEEVNEGLNDVIGIANTSGEILDPGTFRGLKTPQDVQRALTALYGVIPDSADKNVQGQTEAVVSEAITLNNSLYDYAKELDKVGERIKLASQGASPKGAQKLTVESLGVMVTVLNQSLRAQASSLKLQAQAMVSQNHKDKAFSEQVRTNAQSLKAAMRDSKPSFDLPRL